MSINGGDYWGCAPVFQPDEMNVPSLIRRYMALFNMNKRTEKGMRKALEWIDRAKNCKTKEEADKCIDGAKFVILVTLMGEGTRNVPPSCHEEETGGR